ncbi:hypothetical protein Ga0076813_13021, partial [endosymbiont of Ridgeia piscesae]
MRRPRFRAPKIATVI